MIYDVNANKPVAFYGTEGGMNLLHVDPKLPPATARSRRLVFGKRLISSRGKSSKSLGSIITCPNQATDLQEMFPEGFLPERVGWGNSLRNSETWRAAFTSTS
jgi:hypothetical protein